MYLYNQGVYTINVSIESVSIESICIYGINAFIELYPQQTYTQR